MSPHIQRPPPSDKTPLHNVERWTFGGRPFKPIEKLKLDERERLERRYQREPAATHADLIERGYWFVAAQLRIDYQVGRLAE